VRSSAQPHSLSPRGLAVAGWSAFIVAGGLFLAIAWNVSALSALVELDERVAQWLHAHGSDALTAVMLGVTHLNSTVAIGVWSAVFAAVLMRLRERYWMLTLGLSVGGALLLNVLLKHVYERARPSFEQPILVLETYSFPSGHTAAAVAFYGVLAAFLVSRFHDPRRRALCVAGALGAVALVAFSRLYLGAHYLSDVVAAVCSSTAWLVLCLATGHALVRRRLKPRWLAAGAAVLVALVVAAVLPLENWSARLEEEIAGMSLVGGLALFCAANVVATLLMVPAWIFPLVAGAMFGLAWGFAAAMAGAVAGALAAFVLARYVLRKPVERAARRHEAFKAVDKAVAKEGWKVVALLRMSPVLPSGLKSYLLGLTRVRLAAYVGGSALGMAAGILLKVYVGSAGRGALSEGGALNWLLFAAGLAAAVGLTYVIGKKVRARLAL
jgi:uncharacterized membrane protein YdjX (TVP38/TMEM64 family)/membrane-associated phospholipid phosphatase